MGAFYSDLFPNQEMNLYLYPYFVMGFWAKKKYGSHIREELYLARQYCFFLCWYSIEKSIIFIPVELYYGNRSMDVELSLE